MDARTRLLVALENDGTEPDRVPSFVEGMMEKFKGNALEIYEDDIEDDDVVLIEGDWTLYKFFKFDGVWLHSTPVRYKPLNGFDHNDIIPEEGVRVDRHGRVSRLASTGQYKYQTGYLNTIEVWEEWMDAGYFDIEFDNGWVRRWEKAYRRMLEIDIVPVPVTTCFEPIREAFDFGKFSHFYRKRMDFLKKLADRMTDNLMEVAKGWCDSGFEIVTWADDCAYKGRVMFPPRVFQELVEPMYKKLNDYCHKRGVLTFFHSDGFTEPYFDGLIRSGFNGIQSLEPAAGMDLGHLKETYGSKVCLIGNLDCSRLLPYGTEQEVIDATKQCIKDAAVGGGYIFGATTDITDSCNPRNIKAMIDALLRFGKYPINII
ncbi:MAG: uroporphyrinogen decarboxylase family protein [Promethearchaeota archaeon]